MKKTSRAFMAGALVVGLVACGGCGGGASSGAVNPGGNLPTNPAPGGTTGVALTASDNSMPIHTSVVPDGDYATAVWMDGGENGVFVRRFDMRSAATGGGSWSDIQRIDVSGRDFHNMGALPPSLAQRDSFGNLHVLWSQQDLSGRVRVYAARRQDDVFQSPVVLDESPSVDARNLRFDVDELSGQGAAVWLRVDAMGGVTDLVASTFDGTTWSDPHVLSTTAFDGTPGVSVSNGKTLVAWEEVNGAIMYATHESATWQPGATLHSPGPNRVAGLQADTGLAGVGGEATDVVVWLENNVPGYRLRFMGRSAGDAQWSTPTELYTYAGTDGFRAASGALMLSDNLGNLVVSWMESQPGTSRILAYHGSPVLGETGETRVVREIAGGYIVSRSLHGSPEAPSLTWAEHTNLLDEGALFTSERTEEGGTVSWSTSQWGEGYVPAAAFSLAAPVRLWARNGTFPFRVLYGSTPSN